jgi:hydrogenase expression/formation protein HypD
VKYVDEYRDARLGRALLDDISRVVTRSWTIMEICGGQTHTIVRHGIDRLLPKQVELAHGPGCPVCVTALETIDAAIEIASLPGVILVSYGDMLRVPGSRIDLFGARAGGGDVRVVYSPVEALKIARENPARRVVFFGIGFETTAPAHALAVQLAKREGLSNFSMLAAHVLAPPAIRSILESPKNQVHGFIAPGHVCAIAGYREYEELSADFHVPIVVGGFEPIDLIEAIRMLLVQLEEGRAETENQYVRSVKREGNIRAQQVVADVFEVADRKWRGIGTIPRSGLRLRPGYAVFDAERIFGVADRCVEEPGECIGSQVMQGSKKPTDCPAFGGRCTPERPLGALMVSAEGACSAYFRYRV